MEMYLTSLCRKVELNQPGNLGDPRLRGRSIVENNTENPMSASLSDVDLLAMNFYQHALSLCAEFGCPISSIRIQFCSWGIPAGPEVKKGPLSTELVFDGVRWSASRIRVRARTAVDRLGPNVTATATCFLILEAEPDAILKASRRPSKDIWTVQVASWRKERGKAHLAMFDPHQKTNTIWQVAAFKKIKMATTQAECEAVLKTINERATSRKEAIQLYEKIRENPKYKSFNINFQYLVNNLIIDAMAGVLGTATVWDDRISTEF